MALGISHFKALGPDNWHGSLERAITHIEQARAEGMDVTVDFYPYHGTATTLASILPASFLTEDFSRILAKITTPESIDRLRHCYQNPGPKDEIMDLEFRWSHAMISGVRQPENQKYLGKTIHDCAQMAGYDDSEERRRVRSGSGVFLAARRSLPVMKLEAPLVPTAGGLQPGIAVQRQHPAAP